MKRIIAFILTFVLIFAIVPKSIADSGPEKVEVRIDGEMVKVSKVNVMFNDQPIESDVPSIIYYDRTLVPIRFIANYLNAGVEWDGEKYQAIITLEDKEIILTIDSDDVIINGEVKKIPYNVPAKLVNDRTMVPLRFVAEELGCDVEWDSSTWTGLIYYKEVEVTNIQVQQTDKRLPKVIIETTGQVEHNEIYLEEPYRLVIDIPRSKLNIEDKELLDERDIFNLDVGTYPIKEVRASQFSVDPNVTRLVIELDKQMEYKINPLKDSKGIELTFVNKVEEIDLERIGTREKVVIYNTSQPKLNVIRLTEPERIVVDIMDSLLVTENSSYDFETKFIEGLRTSQFEPDALYAQDDKITRVVLDLKQTDKKLNLFVERDDEKIILDVDDDHINNIDYDVKGTSGGFIEIDARRSTKYEVDYDTNTKIMAIKVPDKNIRIDNVMEILDDNFIEYIDVEEEEDYKKISIKFKVDIGYEIQSKSRDDEIEISFVDKDNKYSDKLIVIDPGHGGKDPGAIAPISKMKEKDLNLKVALKLDERLKAEGFNTFLTRDGDEYIDIYERADIANGTDGDMFISIHFNAHDNTSISGIETIYCPAYESTVKTEDNFPLADTIHQTLLEELGAEDRGIERRPELVVIRETKMIAVLVELGFVTNPEEEQKIISEEYQNKLVEALIKGIIKYFDEAN